MGGHVLNASVYNADKEVGFGKPYRGVLLGTVAPELEKCFYGTWGERVPLRTSLVKRIEQIGPQTYVIETMNSVYIAKILLTSKGPLRRSFFFDETTSSW